MSIADELLSAGGADTPRGLEELAALTSDVFRGDDWTVTNQLEPWTEDNKENIWRNELSPANRDALGGDAGKIAFFGWLGAVHFAAVHVMSRKLFDGHVRANAGWRLTVLALPAPRVFISGLAHHYQGTPAQNLLGAVSNFLHDLLSEQLAESPTPLDAEVHGRKVSRDDWDFGGLTEPNESVAGVEWQGALPLRLARTTTTKKTLSTFITVRKHSAATTDGDFRDHLEAYLRLMRNMVS